MASTNDFLVQLLAKLDTSSVNTEYEALKKRLTNDPVIQKVTLDTSMSKQAIKSMASEIHNELGKAFKATGIEDFDITVKDVESILSSAVKESNKLAKELDTASSKAQKFLAQFNNKSGGTLVNSKEFKAVQDAISGLGKTHSIDDLNKAMNTLETTYNNMVSSLRNSGKSLNPFINAKNEMATMDDTIKGIGLEFEKLANKPKAVSDAIKQLSVQQTNVNSHTIGTQEWADAYGKLQQMIQKVKSEISNLQKAQSANVSTQIFNTADLDKQGKVYIQKVRNTIEAIKPELESKLRSAGYTDIEIKGVEKANGQIKSLTATVTDATGAFKQLNFQREKIQGKGKAQFGFVQTDDVKVIGTLSSSVEKVQGNLTTLKNKWEEQGVLVGEFKTKVEQLETSLTSVGSKGELNGLKSQIETLKTEASQIADVNKIQLSWSDGSYEAKYDSLIAKTRQWVDANDESVISTQKLTTAYNEFNQAASNFAKDRSVKNRDILIQKEEELGRQLKATTNDIKVQNAEWAKSSKVDSLHQKIQEFYDKNTATHRTWGSQLKNMLNETAHGAQLTATRVNEIEQEFLGVGNVARQAGKLGDSFFGGMVNQAKKFLNWFSMTSVVMEGIQQGKKAVDFAIKLDDALTDVAYTSNVSAKQLEGLGNSAIDMAKDLNTSAENILEAVKIYSTANSTAEDIMRKSQPAIMLSNISGMSGSESAKTINTSLNQFELEDTEENLLDITDTLQYVSSQLNYDFTEGIKEITEGIEASGNVAKNAGLSMQEYATMVGVAVEKTGQSGSTIGNAYKTIFSRITKASSTEGTLEEEISAAEKSLRSIGVEVRDSEDEFRDLTDIMADLGQVWDSLSSVEKSNVGFQVAGTRQLNVLNSLMGSWEDYSAILGDIDQRSGETLKNQEVYADSLQGHLGDLEATAQSVWSNLVESETVKSGIDLLTGLLNIVDKTTDALGGLGTVGLAGGLFAGIKNAGQGKSRPVKQYACPC